jgi:hypothetical protein
LEEKEVQRIASAAYKYYVKMRNEHCSEFERREDGDYIPSQQVVHYCDPTVKIKPSPLPYGNSQGEQPLLP